MLLMMLMPLMYQCKNKSEPFAKQRMAPFRVSPRQDTRNPCIPGRDVKKPLTAPIAVLYGCHHINYGGPRGRSTEHRKRPATARFRQ
jgi:hypothetical protein